MLFYQFLFGYFNFLDLKSW